MAIGTTLALLGTATKSVSEEDAADSIFNVLMGDVVSLRRDFIQENALDVKNLDI